MSYPGDGPVSAASGPEGTLIVFSGKEIDGVILSRGGALTAPFPIGKGFDATAVWTGSRFLVSWLDEPRNGLAHVLWMTFSASGNEASFDFVHGPMVRLAASFRAAPSTGGALIIIDNDALRLNADGDYVEAFTFAADAQEVAAAPGIVAYERHIGTLPSHTQVVTRTLELGGPPPRRRARR